ncbi:hypothetical protein N7478_006156 [Penicillium angulare]|uniref:uncharacterized protein n=1 Tax=Penicillium angulare TaxID=116970 RepID=UPI0025422115|nr:uncharacterized protein N7478_006156 [Penicillium angulare]KAJ5280784.1 hypothetical protein N7478_006156 [Penicillium angulare]
MTTWILNLKLTIIPEPQAGSNVTSHALSAQLLIRIKAGNITESTLADAAFLVTLRQEIFISNLTQQPMGSIAEHCNIDTSLSPTSDPMWAYRAIALSAKVTDFAYGDNESRTQHKWQALMQYLNEWESLRPPSFEPIFREYERSSSKPFPRLQFCNDYHVAASQYSELSRILLLASDPSICKIRIRILGQGRNHDDAIRESVRLICGVALANRQYMPARSTAGLAISMCGELFHDPIETGVLLELLTDAESHLGWPSLKVKDDLKQLWGLSEM